LWCIGQGEDGELPLEGLEGEMKATDFPWRYFTHLHGLFFWWTFLGKSSHGGFEFCLRFCDSANDLMVFQMERNTKYVLNQENAISSNIPSGK